MSNIDINKLESLEKKIKIKFKKQDLLVEALTHRSYINENKSTVSQNNERLEFIGDAVLELVSTEHLFQKYTNRPEGDLTSFRSALVRTESLAEESTRLTLGKYIFMSKGEEATGGREREYILANTFEALIGAIYLDKGYETAKGFITKNLLYKTSLIVDNRLDIDAKSKLQEIAQEVIKVTPTYKLKSSYGPDHDKTFEMILIIGDNELTIGIGKSKQEAEQDAAKQAIEKWDQIKVKFQI